MIRKFSRLFTYAFTTTGYKKLVVPHKLNVQKIATVNLCSTIKYSFSKLPAHQVLSMPALSPTMSQGKIIKWVKNVGDALEEGDIICQVQTDKATVGFQVTQKGFLAQKRQTDQPVPVGTPVVVVVKKKQQVQQFSNFKFGQSGSKSAPKQKAQQKKQQNTQQKTQQKTSQKTQEKTQQKKQSQPKEQNEEKAQQPQKSNDANFPNHQKLKMPALSPTMVQGKIVKWNIKQGQQYSEGDALCQIQTDKATVAYQATQKGVLAKILAKQNSQMKVNDVLGISVKKKQDAGKFSEYKLGGGSSKPKPAKKPQANQQQPTKKQQKSQKKAQSSQGEGQSTTRSAKRQQSQGGRVFASPAARTLANQKGINLNDIGKGSGPDGRILKQDVDGYKPSEKAQPKQTKQKETATTTPAPEQKAPAPKPKAPKLEIPQNPFEQVPLNNMRKTIAARLTESKTTIPHYYIKCSVEMDKVNALRNQINANEKDNGVKVSVNDIIVKAMALALRDYPNVNTQWHGNVVKKFKYADVSVAVATEGGLITPIVYRADTLGLLAIAKRTKDIAKRARQGKLDPRQYIGGTTTVSNIGMFGVDSVTSVINPPQSTIVGVGKTEKKVLFDEHSSNPDRPFRVAQVMEIIVSADHRVVDGALAAQWAMRIKKYLQNPTHMLL